MQIHCKDRPPAHSRRKACIPCSKSVLHSSSHITATSNRLTDGHRSKIRCSTDHPSCRACQKRNISCVYDRASQPRSEASSHVQSVRDAPSRDAPRDAGNRRDSLSGNVANHGLLSSTNASDSVQAASPPSPLSAAERVDTHALDLFVMDQPLAFDGSDFNSNLSLMFDESFAGLAPEVYETASPLPPISSPSARPFSLDQVDPVATASHGPLDSGNGSAGPVDRISSSMVRFPPEESGAGDLWLSGWRGELAKCQIVLPALGKGLPKMTTQPRYYATTPISRSTCVALQELIKLPFEQSPWQSIKLDDFPSATVLDHCIDLYFANFNQVSLGETGHVVGCSMRWVTDADTRCYRSFINRPSNPPKIPWSPWPWCVLELVTPDFRKHDLFRTQCRSLSIGCSLSW